MGLPVNLLANSSCLVSRWVHQLIIALGSKAANCTKIMPIKLIWLSSQFYFVECKINIFLIGLIVVCGQRPKILELLFLLSYILLLLVDKAVIQKWVYNLQRVNLDKLAQFRIFRNTTYSIDIIFLPTVYF